MNGGLHQTANHSRTETGRVSAQTRRGGAAGRPGAVSARRARPFSEPPMMVHLVVTTVTDVCWPVGLSSHLVMPEKPSSPSRTAEAAARPAGSWSTRTISFELGIFRGGKRYLRRPPLPVHRTYGGSVSVAMGLSSLGKVGHNTRKHKHPGITPGYRHGT